MTSPACYIKFFHISTYLLGHKTLSESTTIPHGVASSRPPMCCPLSGMLCAIFSHPSISYLFFKTLFKSHCPMKVPHSTWVPLSFSSSLLSEFLVHSFILESKYFFIRVAYSFTINRNHGSCSINPKSLD